MKFFKINNKQSLLLFSLIIILFSLKTYIVYQVEFDLGIKNDIQQFLLFINPYSSAIFVFAFALALSGKARKRAYVIISFLMSFILYANVMYYRFFNDFITLPVLMQTKNFGDLGGSAFALLKPYDILYFTDFLIVIGLFALGYFKSQEKVKQRTVLAVYVAAILIFLANLTMAEIDRPQLLTRSFDRNYLVKYLGTYNYHVYDAIQTVKSSSQRALADSNDITEVENFIKANHAAPNEDYFGVGKGMNVIYVSLESFQNFLIDYKLNGQEVTPFLNSLVRDENTFYFDNFFHQTGQGKTSDAEFLMENSLFPLPQGAVYMTKAQNTYQAMPGILKPLGYTSATFHGNYKTFWNRAQIYKSFGYDYFFDAEYYNMTNENTINYGLKDKPFFKESMPLLEGLEQPFYGKFISLSNHFPFVLDDGDVHFPAGETEDKVVNQYFQTAKYMDEAIKEFFDYLKADGLYENTIIVMYGDHYGISENHNSAMEKIIGKEITPFENAQLQRMPLFIHVPGAKGKVVHTYGGQVDVRPTVLHLLGIETSDYLSLGTDLLSKDHSQVVPFRNGDFITNEYTNVKGVCYQNTTGLEVDGSQCDPYSESVKTKLKISDKIVYGDLLRFYTPEGFTKINPNDYDYTKREVPKHKLQ